MARWILDVGSFRATMITLTKVACSAVDTYLPPSRITLRSVLPMIRASSARP
jgi:hypothetical protein